MYKTMKISVMVLVLISLFVANVPGQVKMQYAYRTWKSVGGSFSVEAKLVEMIDKDTIILERKADQKKIKVQFNLIGAKDREYVQMMLAQEECAPLSEGWDKGLFFQAIKDSDEETLVSMLERLTVDNMKELIADVGDVNGEVIEGLSLLEIASANPNIEVLEYMLAQGAEVNKKNECGWTLLHYAASSNPNYRILEYLVAQGLDINAKTEDGRTLLHLAAESNPNVDVVRYLIIRGADINTKDNVGRTLLHSVVSGFSTNVDTLKYLIAQGMDVNAKDDFGTTPLCVAETGTTMLDPEGNKDTIKTCPEEMKEILRAAGAKSEGYRLAPPCEPIEEAGGKSGNELSNVKTSPTSAAAPNYQTPAPQSVPRPVVVNDSNSPQQSPAVTPGRVAPSISPDPNSPQPRVALPYSPLSNVSVSNQPSSPQPTSPRDATNALRHALIDGIFQNVKNAIESGANVNDKGSDGNSPLFLAFSMIALNDAENVHSKVDIDVVKYLIDQGADVNAIDSDGETPLHKAAMNDTCPVEAVMFLVAKGADVNAKDTEGYGYTPLHYAASFNVEVLKYLIEQGADVNAKINSGKTPLDLSGTDEAKSILLAAGGKSGKDLP